MKMNTEACLLVQLVNELEALYSFYFVKKLRLLCRSTVFVLMTIHFKSIYVLVIAILSRLVIYIGYCNTI